MIDFKIEYMDIDMMFRGKNLPLFLERTAPMFRSLVEQHGRAKVDAVYRYFFDFVSRMKWGQWMVLTKVCPDHNARQLFYWVMELIYQSDLCSQMRWKWAPVGGAGNPRAQPSDTGAGNPRGKPSDTGAGVSGAAGSNDELRIVVVPPTPEQAKRWAPFIGKDHYLYIDWYGRLLQDPDCNPDIKPEWLMLDSKAQWGSDTEGDDEQPDDGGEAMPPPPED